MNYTLAGKSVGIIGIARTGLAVAEVVAARGAKATLFDAKTEDQLTDFIGRAEELGVQIELENTNPDLTNFDLIVTSPGVPTDKMGMNAARAAGVEVIAEIELAYRIAKAPIIAITGTNGKTTTTVLTGLMLREAGFTTYIAGNAAGTGLTQDNHTIMPLILGAHRAQTQDIIVAEISSFQLEEISTFAPKIAAVLNVTSDHLDRYSNVTQYAEAKARIFDYQESGDYSIINADDPVAFELNGSGKGHFLQFSRTRKIVEGAYLQGSELIISLDNKDVVACTQSDIPLRGIHNLENVLAASLISFMMGASTEDIVNALKAFPGVAHRMELVASVSGVEYINNSMCTNVDAAIKSIEAVASPVVVICGGRDKNLDYTRLIDTFVERVKLVVLIGEAASTLRNYCERAGYTAVSEADSMEQAIDIAADGTEPGDVVLLAPVCSSFDMFKSFEERGESFRRAVTSMAETDERSEGRILG